MIDWDFVAGRLHYPSEHQMWTNLYVEKKLTITELAQRFAVSHAAVRDALLRGKIPIRPAGGANRTQDPRWPSDEAFLKEVEEFGIVEVAKRLSFSQSAVYKRARRLRQAPAKGDSESSSLNDRHPADFTE